MNRKTAWTEIESAVPSLAKTAPLPAARGRRRRRAPGAPVSIPVVNGEHAIVAWTDAAPDVEGGRLRHATAERLLGVAIFCTQVALARPADIARAGGPANWVGPWRCLALCRIEDARGLEQPRAELAGEELRRAAFGLPPT